jgi:hypothetical protein
MTNVPSTTKIDSSAEISHITEDVEWGIVVMGFEKG